MKARLQKEGTRLDLTAPFGELDPVRGVLLVASWLASCTGKRAQEKKRKTNKKESSSSSYSGDNRLPVAPPRSVRNS